MARTGLQHIEEGIAATGKTGSAGRLGYFNLKSKPGEDSIVVRFLTDVDDILTVQFHEWILDNKGQTQNFVVAPDLYEDPSRTDYVRVYGGQSQDWGTKELSDSIPKTRTVALAVVRKEVVTEGKGGRPTVTYEDEWVDIEGKDGKKYQGRKFIIVKQAYKNFWQPLVDFYDEYKTLCDRDYKIKRLGKGTDTYYKIVPGREDEVWDENSYKALHEHYGYGTDKSDIPDDERYAYCPQTLIEWAEQNCSEERVKFFLGDLADREAKEKGQNGDSSSKASTGGGFAGSDEDEAQAAPSSASGGMSLQQRLSRHN